jgi:hypothetical protein
MTGAKARLAKEDGILENNVQREWRTCYVKMFAREKFGVALGVRVVIFEDVLML